MQVFGWRLHENLLWYRPLSSKLFNHFILPLLWWNCWQSQALFTKILGLIKHVSITASPQMDALINRIWYIMVSASSNQIDFRQYKTSFGLFLFFRWPRRKDWSSLLPIFLLCKRYPWLMWDHGPPLVSNGCRMMIISFLLSGYKNLFCIILLWLYLGQVKQNVPRMPLSLKLFFYHSQNCFASKLVAFLIIIK